MFFLYGWVHDEQDRVVTCLRNKFTNETTYNHHWLNFLQFVKIVAPELVELYAQPFNRRNGRNMCSTCET